MTPIYHITHLDNLARIIADGALLSDRLMLARSGHTVIGFSHIKQRRLEQLRVHCHPGTMVGDYVPFYFCPRSVMLYIIQKRGADLAYKGGQGQVVHLVSSVELAVSNPCRYAFTGTNAGAFYTEFHGDVALLDEVLNRAAVSARIWNDPAIKEAKQAEFLVHERFPWTNFVEIATLDQGVAESVRKILAGTAHQPVVTVRPDWYY